MPRKKDGTLSPKRKEGTLSVKEENFCIAVAAGRTVCEAYQENYDTKKTAVKCNSDAYKVYGKIGVKERIRDAIMDRYAPLILEQEERIRILSNTALNGETKDSLKAIDILNKMDGSYIERIEVKETAQITVYLPQKRLPDGV